MKLMFLTEFVPHITSEKIEALQQVLPRYSIETPSRVACYLAQVLHETGGFRYHRELWGRVPTPDQARYEPPSPKAQRLGNTQPGDGYTFRGWGDIQTTGRGNTLAVSQHLYQDDRLVRDPRLLDDPTIATEAGCFFWTAHRLNEWADLVTEPGDADFRSITLRVNGGYNGEPDREEWLGKLWTPCQGIVSPIPPPRVPVSADLQHDEEAAP